MSELILNNISKVYHKKTEAIKDLSLIVQDAEFVVLIGPSGCGKSTLLRIIAGLDEDYSGDVLIDGENVNGIEAKDRNISMVFQNYSLYPHMTVFQNIAFGLKLKKTPPEEIEKRVKQIASLLGISDLLTRKPKSLSGGQIQRVALGRALIKEPDIFLLDEPLSNIDAKFRSELRNDILALHKQLATTFIYVTHDQNEALTMGDKIVLMDKGKILQVGAPNEVYSHPINLSVATFFDLSPINAFRIKPILKNGIFSLDFGDKILSFDCEKAPISEQYLEQEIIFCVRAEDIELSENGTPATILSVKTLGGDKIAIIKTEGIVDEIAIKLPASSNLIEGSQLAFSFPLSKCFFFDAETGNSIKQ